MQVTGQTCFANIENLINFHIHFTVCFSQMLWFFSYRDSFCFQPLVPYTFVGGGSHHWLKHTSPPWNAKIWGNHFIARLFISKMFLQTFSQTLVYSVFSKVVFGLRSWPRWNDPSWEFLWDDSVLHVYTISAYEEEVVMDQHIQFLRPNKKFRSPIMYHPTLAWC